jgi:hypothetical protein
MFMGIFQLPFLNPITGERLNLGRAQDKIILVSKENDLFPSLLLSAEISKTVNRLAVVSEC